MRPFPLNHECTANICYKVTRAVWRVGNRVRHKNTKELRTIQENQREGLKVLWENKEETEECKRDKVKPTLDITKDEKLKIRRAKLRKKIL